jgi:hypothetical protein
MFTANLSRDNVYGEAGQINDKGIEPIALVAQVSYDNGNDNSTILIIDSGSSH